MERINDKQILAALIANGSRCEKCGRCGKYNQKSNG